MIRKTHRVVVLLLAGLAGCAHGGRPGPDDWRTDWRLFGEVLAPYARAGELERGGDVNAFNDRFWGGVEWRGRVTSVRAGDYGANVEIAMPPLRFVLRDGTVLTLDTLTLGCGPREPGCTWALEMVGKEVVFRTSLENRTRGYQAVVRVEGHDPEHRWIDVEAHGAELVRVGR